jgi:hypothetical protein
MRRIIRAIAISILVACFALSAALSVRRYFASDLLVFKLPQGRSVRSLYDLCFFAGRGDIRIAIRRIGSRDNRGGYTRSPVEPLIEFNSHAPAPFESPRNWGGFEIISGLGPRDGGMMSDTYNGLGAPLWFVLVVTGAAGCFLVRRVLRDRAAKPTTTQCKSCGYDLRAGHDKCPECGATSHVTPESVAKTEAHA